MGHVTSIENGAKAGLLCLFFCLSDSYGIGLKHRNPFRQRETRGCGRMLPKGLLIRTSAQPLPDTRRPTSIDLAPLIKEGD